MNEYRIAMCEDCQNGLKTHESCEIHEVCEAGICILCFQTEKCDCSKYNPIYRQLLDLIAKYGDHNLYYDFAIAKTELGYITSNPDGAIVRYSFVPINKSAYER